MGKKPIIGISMGDPSGIGPEVIIKSLLDHELVKRIIPVIIGDAAVFSKLIKKHNIRLEMYKINNIYDIRRNKGKIAVIGDDILKGVTKTGKWTKETGHLSYQSVLNGIKLAINKKIDAIVTAPICKEAWKAAGVKYHGHTELLADLTKTKDYAMMFVNGPFRIILVTIHEALKKVPHLINKKEVIRIGMIGAHHIRRFYNIKVPRIAVLGLNPHSGESGILGKEEIESIIPAIEYLSKKRGIKISGPHAADTIFTSPIHKQYDLIICMYHDQGLIPFKMQAMHTGVNVTAGIPIIRTSPDHGTAFDLAGKWKANSGSMKSAINTALQMTKKTNKQEQL